MVKIKGEWLTQKKLDELSLPEGSKVMKKVSVFSLKRLLFTGKTEKLELCKAKALQKALQKTRDIYLDANPYRWGGIKVYQSTALLFQEHTLGKEILKIFLKAVDWVLDNLPAVLLGITIALIVWRICR